MYNILISDGLQEKAINNLINLGFNITDKHYNKEDLGEALKEYDALVIRSATKVTRDILEVAKEGKLKLIVRAGVGVDNIDVIAADEFGITVRNTPNSSSDSVAELALAHMFAVARFVGTSNYTMRNGEWNKKKYEGVELSGKTLGIVGMGRIGRSLADKATALGMKVVYNDAFGKVDGVKYNFVELNELLSASDFISLHVPYDKNLGSLIGKKELEIMKDGVYLINCARGRVVDEEALLEALDNGKIAGAGIDVFEIEPNTNEALVNHPRVSCTPHIGASTMEAQERIGDEVVSVIKEFF
ncbi:D-2-hydroxyacid dehydrogenase [Clostridium sp. Sa3CUN1]|uniref:D-2-hydroxyacid dehydrogenase n=1 Tax=Clostridium gallinarum TaxID=2762246 RepID=A0ABR8Q531_9CLOT|nr:D-2-hydroxyacid dehydrogenase [Clostridium gallinarum]MBD7915544.1 D-2-hydroxyacid dehydrogenase [Clostridium gallinarum]